MNCFCWSCSLGAAGSGSYIAETSNLDCNCCVQTPLCFGTFATDPGVNELVKVTETHCVIHSHLKAAVSLQRWVQTAGLRRRSLWLSIWAAMTGWGKTPTTRDLNWRGHTAVMSSHGEAKHQTTGYFVLPALSFHPLLKRRRLLLYAAPEDIQLSFIHTGHGAVRRLSLLDAVHLSENTMSHYL